jgi:hypothetical protein
MQKEVEDNNKRTHHQQESYHHYYYDCSCVNTGTTLAKRSLYHGVKNMQRVTRLAIRKEEEDKVAERRAKAAARAKLRRNAMNEQQRIKYNACAAERMQRMRDRDKLLAKQWSTFCALVSAAKFMRKAPLSVYLADASIPITPDGSLCVPGYELRGGDTQIKFLHLDGMLAGCVSSCKDATAVIDTTGCSELHQVTMCAIRDGMLPKVNRLFIMRPKEG